MIAYHVDRRRSLVENKTIQLFNVHINDPSVQKAVDLFFQEGLSAHGKLYAFQNCPNSSIEQIYELIRQKDFPDKISRFQSFYAFQNLSDAIHFSKGSFPIYTVSFSHKNYHIGDMNMLKGETFLTAYSYARRYWSGELQENSIPEILIKPPLKIEHRISSIFI